MTQLSRTATDFMWQILDDPATPAGVRSAILARIQTPGARETMLEDNKAIVLDPLQPVAARITAMQQIIDVAKGELP